ncbi:helix-turn-helix transcriptional regulator [Amycolatopsis sp. NPDC004079]|uniref:helix-turn-helix domain-containing protein n=1 Tax=Amycolatopsis sp. NPDC004079 TaxID=3154549 RepID=UPI0033B65B90
MSELVSGDFGARLREARARRRLTQSVVADLVGISQGQLSRLESGDRHPVERRLLEDLAYVLGRAVPELTGMQGQEPDFAPVLSPLSAALAAATLDDVPDVPARPVEELARLVRVANRASADSRYVVANEELAALLVESHVRFVTGPARERRAALAAVGEACLVAVGVARSLGDYPLALAAGERARAAAARREDPVLAGFASMSTSVVQARIVDRAAAWDTAAAALDSLARADPDAEDAASAEAAGMLHLALAQLGAKQHDRDIATTHHTEAAALAARTGERRTLCFDFGPSNALAWGLAGKVELGEGPRRAEEIVRVPGYDKGLGSRDRRAALHFDLARGFAQAEGARDDLAVWHLDQADWIAPERIRNDPLSRGLVEDLVARGRCPGPEMDSLEGRLAPSR